MPNQTVLNPIKKNHHFLKPNHIIKTSLGSVITTKTSSAARFKIFDRICVGTENFNTYAHGYHFFIFTIINLNLVSFMILSTRLVSLIMM